MGYLFLALAIIAEVIGTTFLKLTSGEKAVWWAWIVVAGGYVAAFGLISQALSRGIPLGTAYAIWAGVGVVLVAVISWLVFHQSLTWLQIGGMVLVVGGVVLLEAGAEHA